MAILSGKVLISEIHRYLKRHHKLLCELLDLDLKHCISDPQLRRLLALVDAIDLPSINSLYFGWASKDIPKESWISFDGKEIRGTIDGVLGEKRGLNIVHPFVHNDKIVLNGMFYHGLKDSEINCVRELLKDNLLAEQSIIFDALHTQYETLSRIEKSSGTYIAQVKGNQKELLEDLSDHITIEKSFDKVASLDKAHGRIEKRKGLFYDIQGVEFEQRWNPCSLATLIIIDRESTKLKTGKITKERSFYVSNKPKEQIKTTAFFNAIRNHWQIESNNYLRDTTFREDKIKCFNHTRIKTISSMISLANNLLQNAKIKNMKAKLEDIACNPTDAIALFTKIKFL